MFAVHLLLVSLSCLVSWFGGLQLYFPPFENDEPVQNYSLLLDMPNILQIIRSFQNKVIFVQLLWTHPWGYTLNKSECRLEIQLIFCPMPSWQWPSWETWSSTGIFILLRKPLCHPKNPWVSGQYGQHKEGNNISKVCPPNYTVSRFHEIWTFLRWK